MAVQNGASIQWCQHTMAVSGTDVACGAASIQWRACATLRILAANGQSQTQIVQVLIRRGYL
eukprot:2111147-Rhodomonas_salina.1